MTVSLPRASFTRPADTIAYTIGDLVANSVTPGSVVPLSFAVPASRGGTGFTLSHVKMRKPLVSATLATFTLHLFSRAQTLTVGDNTAFIAPTFADYLGSVPV